MTAMIRERNRYAASVIGTLLFAVIYECFSHQVYSRYMLLAFLFPLLGGLIPYTILLRSSARKQVDGFGRSLYDSGIAAWTVGSLFQGILEIYGTTNQLSAVYWIAGAGLVLAGLLCCAGRALTQRGRARRTGLVSRR